MAAPSGLRDRAGPSYRLSSPTKLPSLLVVTGPQVKTGSDNSSIVQ